ncbi:MAG: DUF1592 domain-containing protein [Oligoflexus sp.]|nr:DUF1592 domain-containing protein [Oligoflexus sp.]
MPFTKSRRYDLALTLAAALLSAMLGACNSSRPEAPMMKKGSGKVSAGPKPGKTGNDPAESNTVRSASQKFRGLSSVEVKNTVLDLYAVSIDSVMDDHPAEATDTGFFNSISAFSMSTPLAKWYAEQASLVAGNLALTAPALKDLPNCAAGDLACLEANITKVATRTYRRVPSKAETDALLASIVKSGAKTYLESMSIAVEIMLQSSQFAYHAEAANVSGVLNGSYAVAARLAAVLWQSAPDTILLDAAAKSGLLDEVSVKAQVARMLSDVRSQRGLGQFANEWLRLYTTTRRDLTDAAAAGVTKSVLAGMFLETERTFAAAAMNPKADFLEEIFVPKNTFLTADLAKFYGITLSNASAEPISTLIAADSPRRGILTQASFMFATTKRSSTSLITRGNTVYETILCKEAGAPGADDLAEAAKDAAILRSKRDESIFRMGKAKCGACHKTFDPIGLVFERFDFVGRTRTVDEAKDPIVTTATFSLDGKASEYADALTVSAAFAKSPTVAQCIAERMIAYAFAGNLVDPEEVTLERVSKAFTESGNSFQALVTAIVLTPEFLEP